MPSRPCRPLVLLAAPLALSACAHRGEIAALPAPVEAPPPRPVLAAGLSAVTPPPRGADGAYRTINSGLDADHVVWHVRAALNVAAIGCRGAGDTGTVAAYNAMLAAQKTVLAHANSAVVASVRAQGGDGDAYMTRLYNYFAMPAAKPGFCAAAATLAPRAAATAPQGFPAFAETALPALEAPFLAVYAQVDEYRLASAAWDDRYARTTQMAGAALAPVEERTAAAPALGLPAGAGAAEGRYDMPRRVAGPARFSALPRLSYAEIGAVVAWQPAKGTIYAAR